MKVSGRTFLVGADSLLNIVETKENFSDVFRIVDVLMCFLNVGCVEHAVNNGFEVPCLNPSTIAPAGRASRLRWTTSPCGRQTRHGFWSSSEGVKFRHAAKGEQGLEQERFPDGAAADMP